MKKILIATLLLAGTVFAQAPIPLTIDSRSPTAPAIDPYQASRTVYRVTFVDGTNPVNLTGITGWMSWATNSYASSVSTANVAVVGSTTGIIDFTFSASSLNPSFGPGRYIYEVGLRASAGITVYRQGILTLRGSPYAVGVPAATWTTNAVNWATINWTGLPTTMAGYGIIDGVDILPFTAVSNYAVAAQSDIDAHEAKNGTNVHGLLSAATNLSSAFATAAQGTLAGTALQSEADTNAIAQINTHTNKNALAAHSGLGTASTNAATAFATSAQGATADTAGSNALAALAGVLSQSNRIDTLNTSTNSLNTSVAGLKTSTNALQVQIDALSTNAGTVANITALQGATNALNTRAGNLEISTNAMTVRLTAGEGATNALQIQVAALQGATGVLNIATNSLQSQVAVLKTSTNNLQVQITAVIGATNALQTQATALQGATNALQVQSTALQGATGVQQTAIAEIKTSTNALSARAGVLETATNSMTVRIAATEAGTNALNTRMATAETSTNYLSSQVATLKTSTNALQVQAAALQGATGTLNTSVTALQGATNSLNTRGTNWDNAVAWGDHAEEGYLKTSTNIFSGIYSANRAKLGANIAGLTQGTYTGSLTTVSYTGVTAMVVGRTYAMGFTKANALGTSTLSIASQILTKTAAGAISNYFTYTGADTNLILKLDGDGSSKSDVTAIYVKQITNGNISAAGDLYIANNMWINGTQVVDQAANVAQLQSSQLSISNTVVQHTSQIGGISNAFIAADTGISNAYPAADLIVSNGVTAGYQAADVVVSNLFAGATNALNITVAQHAGQIGDISNAVDEVQLRTNTWNTGAVDASAATNWIATETNTFALHGESNIVIRVVGTNSYIGNIYAYDDAALTGATNTLNVTVNQHTSQIGDISNAVDEVQLRTNVWNTGTIDASSATGNVTLLQGATGVLNTAVVILQGDTNNFARKNLAVETFGGNLVIATNLAVGSVTQPTGYGAVNVGVCEGAGGGTAEMFASGRGAMNIGYVYREAEQTAKWYASGYGSLNIGYSHDISVVTNSGNGSISLIDNSGAISNIHDASIVLGNGTTEEPRSILADVVRARVNFIGNGAGLTNVPGFETNGVTTAFQAADAGISNSLWGLGTGISNTYNGVTNNLQLQTSELQTQTNAPVAFWAGLASNLIFSNNTQRTISWTEVYDVSGAFGGINFVAPVNGLYEFTLHVGWVRTTGASTYTYFKIYTNAAVVSMENVVMDDPSGAGDGKATIGTGVLSLTSGVPVWCAVQGKVGTTNEMVAGAGQSFYSGKLIRKLP